MADGYPIEAQLADTIERYKDELRKWPEVAPHVPGSQNDQARIE
jgi:hypothetical protein